MIKADCKYYCKSEYDDDKCMKHNMVLVYKHGVDDDIMTTPKQCMICDSCGYYEQKDNVNHPSHYTAGEVECIDAIQSSMTEEEFRGYCKGNAIKYIWRERYKGQEESIKKAIWYLKRLLEEKENENS